MENKINKVLDELISDYNSAIIKFKAEQKRIAIEVMSDQALYFTNEFGAAYMLKIDQLQIAATKLQTLENTIVTTASNTLDEKEREEYYTKINNIRKLLVSK